MSQKTSDCSDQSVAPRCSSVYRGHIPHASPGRMSAMRTEENRLTALLSKMGFPQIRRVVADS